MLEKPSALNKDYRTICCLSEYKEKQGFNVYTFIAVTLYHNIIFSNTLPSSVPDNRTKTEFPYFNHSKLKLNHIILEINA